MKRCIYGSATLLYGTMNSTLTEKKNSSGLILNVNGDNYFEIFEIGRNITSR